MLRCLYISQSRCSFNNSIGQMCITNAVDVFFSQFSARLNNNHELTFNSLHGCVQFISTMADKTEEAKAEAEKKFVELFQSFDKVHVSPEAPSSAHLTQLAMSGQRWHPGRRRGSQGSSLMRSQSIQDGPRQIHERCG